MGEPGRHAAPGCADVDRAWQARVTDSQHGRTGGEQIGAQLKDGAAGLPVAAEQDRCQARSCEFERAVPELAADVSLGGTFAASLVIRPA